MIYESEEILKLSKKILNLRKSILDEIKEKKATIYELIEEESKSNIDENLKKVSLALLISDELKRLIENG